MSEPREINPMLRAGLEYGPVLAFLVAYLWLKDNTYTLGGTEYDGFIVVTDVIIIMNVNFKIICDVTFVWNF